MTHAAQSESIFCAFPARSYLEKYYSSVEPENAAFVRSITEYLWPRTEATDTVIEVAGGPCLYSLMSLMASRGQPFDQLTFTDIGWKNLREVECWLQGHPSQFDCDPLLRWLSEEVGVDPDAVARLLRASTWELARFDWRKPVPQAWRHSYDVVSCHFFAESATDDETELVAFLEKLGDLGRPGATLMTSFVCRSADYTVQQRDLPAFAVDETTIFEYLERAGLELEDIEVRSVPSEDPASHSGYEGLLFAAGRLPGRSRARRPQPMSTGVPIGTRPKRLITSLTCMRMHPCDARVPIEPLSPVPWMPTPLTIPIQRALSGFAALPPATDEPPSSPAHGLLGTDHVGLTCLLWIAKRPLGVG